MSLVRIHQIVTNFQAELTDNPLATWGCIIAGLLVFLVFGGLLFDFLLEKRRERQKAKAVERLLKHLASLPPTSNS